jgi:two-component system response regulator HydG
VEVLELAETVASTDSTILLSGESGTGKEVLARYIHELSTRSDGPFFSINCGALPESLLESELFGHVRGSFTGAVKDKEGLLVAAKSGTFFLDEIGEMSPATQVKLLRALQEREVIPVGSTEAVPMDARIVAATNRDLEEEIRRGSFRSDLYYRLNVIALHMPPLRDRREDIPLLARHFLGKVGEGVRGAGSPSRAAGSGSPPGGGEAGAPAAAPSSSQPTLSAEAMEALMRYDWPGNVRELENALERAVAVADGPDILPEHLPARVVEAPTPRLVDDRSLPNPAMEIIERAYIEWVLRAEGGNKSKAAEVLGIDPSTLYRKLARYGISE